MKSLLSTLFLSLFTLMSINIYAQEIAAIGPSSEKLPTGSEPAAAEEEEKEGELQVSGFVDAYYQYHFEESPFPTSFTETHNSFTPGMANVVLSKEGKFGFVADLAVGPRAEVANGYNGTTLALIKQLYITYAASEKVSFTLGNFGTHVGYEVIDAPANINYSTSYMFSNGPFFHTGLKADFALSENFGAMVGVFNDTDTKIDEVDGKHFGAQLSYEAGGLAAYLNFITGKEDDSNPDDEIRGTQVDLTATYQVTDEFGLGLNTTTKTVSGDESGDASWFGAALYANYAFSDAFMLGLRGEYIGDDDGLIAGVMDNSITSITLSGNFHLGPITLIPEFRIDMAKEDAFTDKDGNPTSSSPALIFAAVYSF
ncbi:MAG: porin [Bacteroidota bacterium]